MLERGANDSSVANAEAVSTNPPRHTSEGPPVVASPDFLLPPKSARQEVELCAEVADRRHYNLVTVHANTEAEFEEFCAEWVIFNCPQKTLVFTQHESDCISFTATLRRRTTDRRGIFATANNILQKYVLHASYQLWEVSDTIAVACEVIAWVVNVPDLKDIVFYKGPATVEAFVACTGRTDRGALEGNVTWLVWAHDPELPVQRVCMDGVRGAKRQAYFVETQYPPANGAGNPGFDAGTPTSMAARPPIRPFQPNNQVNISQPANQRGFHGRQRQHQRLVRGPGADAYAAGVRGRGRGRYVAHFH